MQPRPFEEWIDKGQTSTYAVFMHAPQMNTLWGGDERGTTKALVCTLPRRVGIYTPE